MRDYYDALYRENEQYWGRVPSPVALLLLSRCKPTSVLDLGCGQGPDAVYFAQKGVAITAIDIAPAAIDALKRHAAELKLTITALAADMRAAIIGRKHGMFDAIFTRMALQTLPPSERRACIDDLKLAYPDAVHAHIIPIQGACFGEEFICDDNLLKKAYADWDIIFYEEAWTISRVPNKDGEPFLMREARIIARKKSPS